jgi:hypothetical protein
VSNRLARTWLLVGALPLACTPSAPSPTAASPATTAAPPPERISIVGGLDAWSQCIVAKAQAAPERDYTECRPIAELDATFVCVSYAKEMTSEQVVRATYVVDPATVPTTQASTVALVGAAQPHAAELRPDDRPDLRYATQAQREALDAFVRALPSGKPAVVIGVSLNAPTSIDGPLSYGLLRAQYALLDAYRKAALAYWRGLPPADRDAVKAALRDGYDVASDEAMAAELQAQALMVDADDAPLAKLAPKHEASLRQLLAAAGASLLRPKLAAPATRLTHLRALTCGGLARDAAGGRGLRIVPDAADAARFVVTLLDAKGGAEAEFAGRFDFGATPEQRGLLWSLRAEGARRSTARVLFLLGTENQMDARYLELSARVFAGDKELLADRCFGERS